jgi:hypothetical protein
MLNAGLTAQCNDYADFLLCLSNALGAKALRAQRGNGPFTTKPVTKAPLPPPPASTPGEEPFDYHQWTNSGNVWDAAIRFGGTETPANLALATYKTKLVKPGSGAAVEQVPFLPIIKNHR